MLLCKESGVYYDAHNKLVGKSNWGLGVEGKSIQKRFKENVSRVWPSFQIFFFNTIFPSRFYYLLNQCGSSFSIEFGGIEIQFNWKDFSEILIPFNVALN
jgi:hypothetical protein